MSADPAQTRHARRARTRLNLATTYLEAAHGELLDAGLRQKAGTAERLARETAELLAALPVAEVMRT